MTKKGSAENSKDQESESGKRYKTGEKTNKTSVFSPSQLVVAKALRCYGLEINIVVKVQSITSSL